MTSCDNFKNSDLGPNEIYTSSEIGWTIEIPKGWDIIGEDILDENDKKGADILEQVAEDIDFTGFVHLISFSNSEINSFNATVQPLTEVPEWSCYDNNQYVNQILIEAYELEGIPVDTSSSIKIIDGLEFEGFHMTVYGPNGNVILTQDMYSRYINGYDFAINMNYNDEASKNEMLKVLEASTFEKEKSELEI